MSPEHRKSGYTHNGVEVAALQQPRESWDHDRILFNTVNGLYGLFDGTATAIASDFVLRTIREQTTYFLAEKTPAEIISYAQTSLLELPELQEGERNNPKLRTMTTASIVRLKKAGEKLLCSYASAGDSPIYHFSQRGGLTALAEDESHKTPPFGDEIVNFLGSSLHKLSKKGEVQLEAGDSVAIMSDGVSSKRSKDGISDDELKEVLQSSSSALQAAEAILDSSSIDDDKTIILIRV